MQVTFILSFLGKAALSFNPYNGYLLDEVLAGLDNTGEQHEAKVNPIDNTADNILIDLYANNPISVGL
ncbi:Oidioi.mRNA.OKI2018_I69.chr2.g4345.t1.cds [Oikopleura dioica]|uniref:Oidioi.mRNA.OKI2018_I69.chr2.g4345.t1.cds n=1 Tax=Oikopleura dioica TaxID=34765 RepID=A0ABN7SWT4_OIKDI|nr:Oidioi.mRNA.OKI2018_I69.chr2.g4345.t1.cds [Oikopleura dioica]